MKLDINTQTTQALGGKPSQWTNIDDPELNRQILQLMNIGRSDLNAACAAQSVSSTTITSQQSLFDWLQRYHSYSDNGISSSISTMFSLLDEPTNVGKYFKLIVNKNLVQYIESLQWIPPVNRSSEPNFDSIPSFRHKSSQSNHVQIPNDNDVNVSTDNSNNNNNTQQRDAINLTDEFAKFWPKFQKSYKDMFQQDEFKKIANEKTSWDSPTQIAKYFAQLQQLKIPTKQDIDDKLIKSIKNMTKQYNFIQQLLQPPEITETVDDIEVATKYVQYAILISCILCNIDDCTVVNKQSQLMQQLKRYEKKISTIDVAAFLSDVEY